MSHTDPNLIAVELRDALRPLWRRLNARRSLSIGKVGILALLERGGPSTATALASAERVSHQAVTTAVRELEELGLVERTPDPADRRRTTISISERGRARLAEERASGQDWLVDSVDEKLSPEERETLAAAIPLLRRLSGEDER